MGRGVRALQIAYLTVSACYVDCFVLRPAVVFKSSGSQLQAIPNDQLISPRLKTAEHRDDSSTGKGAYLKSRVKRLLSTIRFMPIIPVAGSLLAGYRLGIQATKGGTLTATGTPSSPIVTRVRKWPVVTILLIAFGIKEIWFATPEWIKRNIPFLSRARTPADDGTNNNDLTSLVAISSKLQSLFTLASDKLKTTPEELLNLRIVFFALLQLMAQIKAQAADLENHIYIQDGAGVELSELEGLDELFEFADWAYDELPNGQPLEEALAEHGFTLIRHDKTNVPGYVSHYLAISKAKKTALIGVKGTSSFGDILTDCCGLAVSHDLMSPFVQNGILTIRCHEGILISALGLFTKLELLVEELLLPTGYNILITGHSLGAGVAALLGILLRSRFPRLQLDGDGTGTPVMLRVVAFASPPILDCDSALACKPFVTTVVNNADLIPRASLSNLAVLMEFLKNLNETWEQTGIKPKNLVSVSQFVSSLTRTNSELAMTMNEITEGLNQACEKVELRDPDHLFVPGRVVHMYDFWSNKNDNHTVNDTMERDSSDEGTLPSTQSTVERAQMTDGTSRALRTIELDSRFLADHLAPAYRSSIRSLLDLQVTKSTDEIRDE